MQPYQQSALTELKRWKRTQRLQWILETRIFSEAEVQLILRELPKVYRLKKAELAGK